jgi:hypothetical protein
LKVEENGLKSLANLERLERLQNLQLAGNRINDFAELDKLGELPRLRELSLVNNPLIRKNLYRQVVIRKLPRLEILDAKAVSQDELERVEQMFTQEVKPQGIVVATASTSIASAHPLAIPSKVPMRMNPVSFDTVFGCLKVPAPVPTPAEEPAGGSAAPSAVPSAASSASGSVSASTVPQAFRALGRTEG